VRKAIDALINALPEVVGLTGRFCRQNGRGVSGLAGRQVLGTSRGWRQSYELLRLANRVETGGFSGHVTGHDFSALRRFEIGVEFRAERDSTDLANLSLLLQNAVSQSI
jgi:hypothetical protein